MLQRVREFDAEIDRRSHGRLDPLLHDVDVRLQKWASWAATERAEWPPAILATDAQIERLPLRLGAAVRAHYLHRDLTLAGHVTVYAQLLSERQPGLPAGGRGAYQKDLDLGRWVVRYALLQPAPPPETRR
jgi:hypothetical protein